MTNVNYNTGHEDLIAYKMCHGVVVSDFIELGMLNSLYGKININVVKKIMPTHRERSIEMRARVLMYLLSADRI